MPDPANPQSWNRYSYVQNNPLRFNDPTGHVVACDDDDWACQTHWDYPPPTEHLKKYEKKLTEKQKKIHEFLIGVSEFVVSAAYEPVDWISTYDTYKREGFNPWMLAGLLPIIPSSAGKYADAIVNTGYDSFRQLKNAIGNAGDGMDWHHIVEQSQIAKSGFSPKQIHNVDNILAVDKTTHRQISGFYNSNVGGPGTQRVRDWLAGQSFEAQYEFGVEVLRKFGVIP